MLIFSRSGKSSVGLDVGSHSVKVVEIERAGKGLKLSKFAVVELAAGTVIDGEVINRDHLVESIKDALTKSGIKTKSVNSAVSGRSVIVRRIPMEKMTEAQARQAIHWEAEQHIPFRVDEVSIDFKILNEESSAGQMEVLLVAAKKEGIDLHRSIIQSTGLKTAAVDLEQFALLRAYENSYHPTEDDCVTILNVGSDNTNLVITKGGIPSFNRDLAIGAGRFIESIVRTLGLEYDDAVKAFKGETVEGVSEEEVKNAVSSVLEELSTSVRRSFISFQASGESSRIDKMLISGGCSLMSGLAETLSEHHGLPVERFNAFGDIQLDAALLADETEKESVEAVLSVAVGLALKGLEPGSLDIDILPEEDKSKKNKKSSSASASPLIAVLSWLPLGLIVIAVIVLFIHYSGLTTSRDGLNQNIEQKNTEIASMQQQVSRQQELDALEGELLARRAAVNALALQQKNTVYVLEYLVRALYPEQTEFAEESGKTIYLTELSYSSTNLHIAGIARTWGDIVAFQTRLDEIKPDGVTPLFSLEEFGQNYNVAPVADASGSETRYQFSADIAVNQMSLEPLVGDNAGI